MIRSATNRDTEGPGEPLVLDGAMGMELIRRGLELPAPLWSAAPLLADAEPVVAIHAAYLDAGADVLTTNTFRTNVRAFAAAGLSRAAASEATHRAVWCAREAIARARPARRIRIAGSVAPVEDCYEPGRVPADDRLRAEHADLARWLVEAGVDLILVETMNTTREAVIAVEAARAAGAPVWASFACRDSEHLLSGEPLANAARAVVAAGAEIVGVNCGPPPAVEGSLDVLRSCGAPLIAYPNGGMVDAAGEWHPDPALDARTFEGLARRWFAAGARVVGGCCGCGVEHVGAVRRVVDKLRAAH